MNWSARGVAWLPTGSVSLPQARLAEHEIDEVSRLSVKRRGQARVIPRKSLPERAQIHTAPDLVHGVRHRGTDLGELRVRLIDRALHEIPDQIDVRLVVQDRPMPG